MKPMTVGKIALMKVERPLVDDRLITYAELRERIPFTRQTIWRMVRDGRFPPPIRLTTSRTVWRLSTVLAWIAYRESHPFTTRSYFGNVPRK
jgi:predicted DNA-binding transcriptional regulator AlpA